MNSTFSENLRLALKMVSMTSAQLASELGTHKSVVSRWLNGSVQPTPHNISRLTALVQKHVKAFRLLDWERDPDAFAELFGVSPGALKHTGVARVFPSPFGTRWWRRRRCAARPMKVSFDRHARAPAISVALCTITA